MLQHAILVDTRFVCKRIGTDNRLVRLHRIAGDAGDQLGSRYDLGRVDTGFAGKYILPCAHRHHYFFE